MPTQSPAKASQSVQTMKAVRIPKSGGPEVLVYEDAPRPEPGTGQALVRVHAAGVNPFDWKVRQGYLKEMIPFKMPLILGWDFSGVIEAVGSGFSRFKKGDAAFGDVEPARAGAYAECVVVKESEIASKPKTIDHL